MDLDPEHLRIDRAEEVLRSHGFGQVRVRDHGDLARIEFDPAELPRLFDGVGEGGDPAADDESVALRRHRTEATTSGRFLCPGYASC